MTFMLPALIDTVTLLLSNGAWRFYFPVMYFPLYNFATCWSLFSVLTLYDPELRWRNIQLSRPISAVDDDGVCCNINL